MVDVLGYEGIYTISSNGVVFNIKKNRAIKIIDGKDYYRVFLFRDGAQKMPLLHRLLAIAFIDNEENKPCVNHIDGNKKNNDIENLEWVTHSENLIHAYETGLNKKVRPVDKLALDGEFVARYKSARDAERDGFANQNIAHCCSGKRKTHMGFRWRYSNV